MEREREKDVSQFRTLSVLVSLQVSIIQHGCSSALLLPPSVQHVIWREESRKQASPHQTQQLLILFFEAKMCCSYCEELSLDLKNGLRSAKPLKIIVIFHLILLSLTLSIFSVNSSIHYVMHFVSIFLIYLQIYVDCRPINDAPSVFVLGSCVFFFLVSIVGIFMSFIHEFWS